MSVYRTKNNRPLSGYTPAQRASGQVILYGTDPTVSCPKGIFYLELLRVDDTGAGITLKDGDGVTMATGVLSFEQDQSPIRCDNGITLTGFVIIAKGFIVEAAL